MKLHYTNTGNPVDFPLEEPVVIELDDGDMPEGELYSAEYLALNAADNFLTGDPDWNDDDFVQLYCMKHDYDFDFMWLAMRVLFAPAVWYTKTGKVM
jgi:hypothetical protein